MTKRHLLLCVSPGVEPGDSSRRGTPDGARHVPQSVALEPTYPHLKVSLRRALTTLRQQSPREPEPGTSVRSVVSYYFVFAPKGTRLEAMVKASPKPATYLLAAREMKDLGNDAAARAFRSRGVKLGSHLENQLNGAIKQ